MFQIHHHNIREIACSLQNEQSECIFPKTHFFFIVIIKYYFSQQCENHDIQKTKENDRNALKYYAQITLCTCPQISVVVYQKYRSTQTTYHLAFLKFKLQ